MLRLSAALHGDAGYAGGRGCTPCGAVRVAALLPAVLGWPVVPGVIDVAPHRVDEA